MVKHTGSVFLGGAVVVIVAGFGAIVMHQSTASGQSGGGIDIREAAEQLQHEEVSEPNRTWFGHVKIDHEYVGLVRYDEHFSIWTVAFADRFDVAPWDFLGYTFKHDGALLHRPERFHGEIQLQSTDDGVLIKAGEIRLLVDWNDLPEPEPMAELQWVLDGNDPVIADPFQLTAVPDDLNDENCPGGWCWCVGPQGVGSACCIEGQEPFCECTGTKSYGGCRKKVSDARIKVLELDTLDSN